jgi:hypothetical protein
MRRDDRQAAFDAFVGGQARFLVNVGVATEGTDLPACACVAVVRPTLSRALFVQMVGRGTRLHPGKRDCLVLNFAPSNARHRLITPTDALLPADADPETRELAARAVADDETTDLGAAVAAAIKEAPMLRRERRLGAYEATLETWDPFSLVAPFVDLGIAVDLDAAGRTVEGAHAEIVRLGVPVDVARSCTPGLASAVLRALQARRRAGLCSFKTARTLARHRLNPHVSREDGRRAMAALERAGWRYVPDEIRRDPAFAPEAT